jgi:hypothetical protein
VRRQDPEVDVFRRRRAGPAPREQSSAFQKEAASFVSIVGDIAPTLELDYSAGSIQSLEDFIASSFDPPGSSYVPESLAVGVGCYVGEVVIRTLGGRWSPDGGAEVRGIGHVNCTFPIQKAQRRFANGPEDSLSWYYEVLAYYAAGEDPAVGDEPPLTELPDRHP